MSVSAFSDVVRARVMARSGGYCEACGRECSTTGQYHHRRPRGAGGSRDPHTGAAANCMFVCPIDHDRIERNRALAREWGWLVRQSHSPADTPLLRYGRWVLLDDQGGLVPVVPHE